MKIQTDKTTIVVGKRITFGALVGAAVSFGVWLYNVKNPGSEIPAEQAVALTTLLTGIGQIIIVNKLGVTTV